MLLAASLLVACGGKLLVDTGNDGQGVTSGAAGLSSVGGAAASGGTHGTAEAGTPVAGNRSMPSEAGQTNGGTEPIAHGGAASGSGNGGVAGNAEQGGQGTPSQGGAEGGAPSSGGAATQGGANNTAGEGGSDAIGAGGDTAETCKDFHQDGTETDADCGGKVCAPCGLDKHCEVDTDCASFACDSLTSHCTFDPCANHHIDQTETDVDCGGLIGICARCPVGKTCKLNADCQSGHTCSVTEPHVCK